jgi:pimeloyl-ACP methyl ester carboxylesterase
LITVAFAVVPARSDEARPDPIVPLYGGPGEEVIAEAGALARQFDELLETRDLLLVDHRGTGRSNALQCRLFDRDSPEPNLRHFLPPQAVAACARELTARADLTQYTSLHFARDLERVRTALGYGPLNLYAGSYGTRSAQVYMRAWPASVRTALLTGAVPIDVVTPLTMARASQEAFEDTLDACQDDAACHAAYPELREEFLDVLKRLADGEARLPVPGGGAVTLSRGRAVEWLRSQVYRPSSGAKLPWLIDRAHSGDWAPFIEGVLAHAAQMDRAFALGLWFSITCSEDVAFLDESEIAPATAGTWLGDYRVREQLAACRHWPRATMPAGHREPLRTGIPTMFVSGDMDAATPLWFTERMAPGFANRVEVVAHGQGHTEWNDCVGGLYRRFVETGEAKPSEPACPALRRPPFRLPEGSRANTNPRRARSSPTSSAS